MGSLSIMHWAIIIIVVSVLFGRNMISNTMADIGKGLKQLRDINKEEHSDET